MKESLSLFACLFNFWFSFPFCFVHFSKNATEEEQYVAARSELRRLQRKLRAMIYVGHVKVI